MEFSKFKRPINSNHNSVFNRIIYLFNVPIFNKPVSISEARVLGPIPNPQRIYPDHGTTLNLCSNCLSPAHSWLACKPRCRRCLAFGHVSGNCHLSPQSARSNAPSNSRNGRSHQSLISGPRHSYTPRFYHSVTEYITELTGIHSIPSPVTVPWRRPRRLRAPEFIDEEPSTTPPPTVPSTSSSSSLIVFSSFSEYANRVLGIHRPCSTIHVAWVLKTPFGATVNTNPGTMAYRFVDPVPFMPAWGQRVMVPGRPIMRQVVTGCLHRVNNDIAIAFIHPLPQAQMNLMTSMVLWQNFWIYKWACHISQSNLVLLDKLMSLSVGYHTEMLWSTMAHINLATLISLSFLMTELGIIELQSIHMRYGWWCLDWI